jgi:predicted metal-binding membrane protein
LAAGPVFLLLGGYVAAWTAFGVAAHNALQASLQAAGLTPGASRMLGPVALIMAGAYQLTPLKRRFVQRSCSPPIAPQGRASRWWSRGVVLGAREGVVCFGCCWALMLLMLAGVAGSSGGMLALGCVMWIEKNTTWGRRLVMPLGLFLIGLGLVLGWGSLLRTLPMHEHSM